MRGNAAHDFQTKGVKERKESDEKERECSRHQAEEERRVEWLVFFACYTLKQAWKRQRRGRSGWLCEKGGKKKIKKTLWAPHQLILYKTNTPIFINLSVFKLLIGIEIEILGNRY